MEEMNTTAVRIDVIKADTASDRIESIGTEQDGRKQRKLAYNKQYRDDNRELLRAKAREYYAKNRERILRVAKQYRTDHYEVIVAKQRDYYKRNRDKRNAYNRKARAENPDAYRAYGRESYRRHREKRLRESELYRLVNGTCTNPKRHVVEDGMVVAEIINGEVVMMDRPVRIIVKPKEKVRSSEEFCGLDSNYLEKVGSFAANSIERVGGSAEDSLEKADSLTEDSLEKVDNLRECPKIREGQTEYEAAYQAYLERSRGDDDGSEA